MPDPRHALILRALGRYSWAVADLHEELLDAFKAKLPGYGDPGLVNDTEHELRAMRAKGLVRMVNDEWRQGATEKQEAMLFDARRGRRGG